MKPSASPGGSPRPACDYSKRERGDGRGRPLGVMPKADVEEKLFGEGFFKAEPLMLGTLRQRFLYPPFSVLNARDGEWQARKRAWIRLGIRGEEGRAKSNILGMSEAENRQQRGDGPAYGPDRKKRSWGTTSESGSPGDLAAGYKQREESAGNLLGMLDTVLEHQNRDSAGTSVFDPVLCELVYRWFCPDGGLILDPFAGGSVRGVVASILGYPYCGVEVREEQVEANLLQAQQIGVSPHWILGDSLGIDGLLPQGRMFDLVFACPPYYDLEVYSARADDGSAKQSYGEFMRWYTKIFQQCVDRLRQNRFLVVVVGEIRNRETGIYRNFVGDTIRCFTKYCGLSYYNEMILVTAVGSLPIRVNRQFTKGRKVGKTHQNVLVFYKGDVSKIRDEFSEVIGE